MKKCIVVGSPIGHSKSPMIHNFAYKMLGIDSQYFFEKCEANFSDAEQFSKFKDFVSTQNIAGISVTMPNKILAMSLCDKMSDDAEFIGSVNSIVVKDGVFYGYNTDWMGVVGSLPEDLKNKKIALLGAGGMASAALFGLVKKQAKVFVFNRGIDKVKNLGERFNVEYFNLAVFDARNFDIIINATNVGMGNSSECIIDTQYISEHHIVMDSVYDPLQTKLLFEAERNGAKIINGIQILLNVIVPQIKLYTGFDIGIDILEESLKFTE